MALVLAHTNRAEGPQIDDLWPWPPSVPHAMLDKWKGTDGS
jgi:hypothetical protein